MASETKDIRSLSRFITTHDANGKAIFSNQLSEEMPVADVADSAHFSLAYTTNNFPARLHDDKDIPEYVSYLNDAPGLVVKSGTVCRIVDMRPGATSPMHRTLSLDYGVVLEGEVELVLDSGETRLLKRGDVAVQRATNHAWRNTSATNWARMLYVLAPAETGMEAALGEAGIDEIGVRRST